MRTFILTMLLATSAATPALADRNDDNGHRNRDQSSEEARPQHAPRAPQAKAPLAAPQIQMNRQVQPQPQPQGGERVRGGGMSWGNANGGQPAARPIDPAAMQRYQDRRSQSNDRSRQPVDGSDARTVGGQPQGWTRIRNGATSTVTINGNRQRGDGQRFDGQHFDGQRSPSGVQWRSTNDRDRDRQHWDGHRDDGQRWSNDWRRDRRYDWRDYRNNNRNIFRVGRYYDPFGYGYQRLNIGFTLFSGYYQSNYWLNDPYQYRLPPTYGPYRWVRYFDDAVLVDIYSGEVVDVIQGFFW